MSVKTNQQAEGRMPVLRSSTSEGGQNAESRITHHASRTTLHATLAFTLLELLTVIAIMGIIAAIALPSIRSLKPNAKVAGTRQLLDAVSRARQLALSQRTTVYMVFVPTNFWKDASWTAADWTASTNLFDKQLVGYAYVCLRSVGDQPAAHTPHYLSSWRTLPAGAYIPLEKFWNGLTLTNAFTGGNLNILPFSVTTSIPFPSETNLPGPVARPYVALPYIAFDGTGQLVSGVNGQPELIPIAEGSVAVPRDPNTKVALPLPAQATEQPPGNTRENYSLIYIDHLTGRAHVERRTVQ